MTSELTAFQRASASVGKTVVYRLSMWLSGASTYLASMRPQFLFSALHKISAGEEASLGYLRPYLKKTGPIATETLWAPPCLSIVQLFLVLSWGELLHRSVYPLCDIPGREQKLTWEYK